MRSALILLAVLGSIVQEIEKRQLPKYKFDLAQSPIEDANFSIDFSSSSGYKCRVPDGTRKASAGKPITDTQVKALLSSYIDTKLILDRGEWWLYELNFGQWFRQFHIDRPGLIKKQEDPVPTSIILGLWTTTGLKADKLPIFQSDQTFEFVLPNGDRCGADSVPRETTLAAYCKDRTLDSHLVDIHETSTCKYKVMIHMKELCASEHIEDALIQCSYKTA